MKNNFKCKNCGKEFHIPSFRVSLDHCKPIYWERLKKMTCPFCKSENIIFIERKTNFKTIKIGKFNSLSGEEKRDALRKRAHEHHLKHDLDLVKYKNEQMEGKLLSKALEHGKIKR